MHKGITDVCAVCISSELSRSNASLQFTHEILENKLLRFDCISIVDPIVDPAVRHSKLCYIMKSPAVGKYVCAKSDLGLQNSISS